MFRCARPKGCRSIITPAGGTSENVRFRAFRLPPLRIRAVHGWVAGWPSLPSNILPEGYAHAWISSDFSTADRLTCSRASRREMSDRPKGRPALARSGPEIGLQIATVRSDATVEGSAARPSRPAAGTRPRRPYLCAMWVYSALASGVAFAAAARWSRHRTSRTASALVLLGGACRCGKKGQHAFRHHKVAV